ncbi:MAG: Lrp/AsnC family transcriptional regulator [bacterium]
MAPYDNVDEHDEAILKLLQENARHLSSGEISEKIDLSASAVRKRIKKLEDQGIIKGYSADIDYEKSGHPMRMVLFCTAPIPERGDMVEEILEIPGVVSVQELVTGDENLLIEVIGERDSDITPVAEELLDLGLKITDEVLVRQHETSPFDGFVREETEDDNES